MPARVEAAQTFGRLEPDALGAMALELPTIRKNATDEPARKRPRPLHTLYIGDP